MLCFPQLSTGGMSQFPITRRRKLRSVVNETAGGERFTWLDAAAETLEWELTLAGLTTTEWGAIEALFESCGGRAADFLFLDPLDNLLGWSEDLNAAIWTADPLLARTSGRTDPLGTARATQIVNAGQSLQRISQTLNAPSWFHYCLGMKVRSETPDSIKLALAAAGQEETRVVGTGPEWREVWLNAQPGGTAETIRVSMELAPGAAVDVFGLQLEAQRSPSAYMKTAGRGGVYPATRFSSDALRCKTDGVDWHSAVVGLTSRREGV